MVERVDDLVDKGFYLCLTICTLNQTHVISYLCGGGKTMTAPMTTTSVVTTLVVITSATTH